MNSSLSGLQPWLRPWAEQLVRIGGQHVRITSVYRSWGEQLKLWLTRYKNPYPVAPPGRSMHNLGRAWDMTGDRRVLHYLGAVWKSWGGTWSPSDEIHFEA